MWRSKSDALPKSEVKHWLPESTTTSWCRPSKKTRVVADAGKDQRTGCSHSRTCVMAERKQRPKPTRSAKQLNRRASRHRGQRGVPTTTFTAGGKPDRAGGPADTPRQSDFRALAFRHISPVTVLSWRQSISLCPLLIDRTRSARRSVCRESRSSLRCDDGSALSEMAPLVRPRASALLSIVLISVWCLIAAPPVCAQTCPNDGSFTYAITGTGASTMGPFFASLVFVYRDLSKTTCPAYSNSGSGLGRSSIIAKTVLFSLPRTYYPQPDLEPCFLYVHVTVSF